jgi:hypothetical protein
MSNFIELALWNQKFNNDNQTCIKKFIEKYESKITKCTGIKVVKSYRTINHEMLK